MKVQLCIQPCSNHKFTPRKIPLEVTVQICSMRGQGQVMIYSHVWLFFPPTCHMLVCRCCWRIHKNKHWVHEIDKKRVKKVGKEGGFGVIVKAIIQSLKVASHLLLLSKWISRGLRLWICILISRSICCEDRSIFFESVSVMRWLIVLVE